MQNKTNFIMNLLSVIVYGYLIFPSVKWLFFISPEQRIAFMGDSASSITYLSVVIVVLGLASIVVLVSQLFKKIELNTLTGWGVKVLMINVVIEIITFLILFALINMNFISASNPSDTLISVANFNMYFNIILQVVATALIVSGGVVAIKKLK